MRRNVFLLLVLGAFFMGCSARTEVVFSKSPLFEKSELAMSRVAVLPIFFYKKNSIKNKKGVNLAISGVVRQKVQNQSKFLDYKKSLDKLRKGKKIKMLIAAMELFRKRHIVDKLAIFDLGVFLGIDYVVLPVLMNKAVDKYVTTQHYEDGNNYTKVDCRIMIKIFDVRKQCVVFTALANGYADVDNKNIPLVDAVKNASIKALARL